MKNLENKNIIVTGASGGIGNAIIKQLNEAGANILASGTRIEKLEELKKKFKNIRSPKLLKPIIEILNKNDFYINNLDINLICEQPKVSRYRDKIINSLSNLLNLDKNLINLKGKTVEKLGLIGKEKAIACEVICSISQ